MLIVALAFVVVPLVRDRAGSALLSGAVSNVAIYKSQRRELDEELARGAISDSEHRAALGELSLRVVDEVPEQAMRSGNAPTPATRPWWLVAVMAIVVPLGAALLYSVLGTPRAIEMAGAGAGAATPQVAPGMPNAQPGATGSNEPPMSDKQIVAMVDSLAQKMQQNPNDPRGWILLARSQASLGRFPEAVAAFERATALQPNDAQLFADFADASAMAQQGRFDGKPYELIKRSLALAPTNMKALALAGTADLRMGNRAGSLTHWEKLKTLLPKDSADYREVESIIAEVKSGKIEADAPASAAAPPAAAIAAVPTSNASTSTAAKSAGKVTGRVVLAPEVAGKLAAGDTLFVFARAKEGPRMPLAVMRVSAPPANAFPFAFELSDAMAMAPGLTLSAFTEVVIEARISKSGNAQLQPGDLSGLTGVIKPGASGVTVTVAKVAP